MMTQVKMGLAWFLGVVFASCVWGAIFISPAFVFGAVLIGLLSVLAVIKFFVDYWDAN